MVLQSPNSGLQNIDVLCAFKFMVKAKFRNIHVSKISGPIKIWTKQAQTQSHFKMFSAPFDIQIPKAKNNHHKTNGQIRVQCWTSSFSLRCHQEKSVDPLKSKPVITQFCPLTFLNLKQTPINYTSGINVTLQNNRQKAPRRGHRI